MKSQDSETEEPDMIYDNQPVTVLMPFTFLSGKVHKSKGRTLFAVYV
jgi:hypothetical protein